MTRTTGSVAIFFFSLIASVETSYPQDPRRGYELTKDDPVLFKFFANSTVLQTPLALKCGLEYDLQPINLPDSLANMEGMELRYFYGRLWPNKRYLTFLFGLVGDLIYPRIATYRMNGTPIDALDSMPYCGGIDDTSEAASVMILSNDRTVSIVDTLDCLTVDSRHEIVPGSRRSRITTKVSKLDATGHFSQVKKHTQTVRRQ